MARDLLDRDRVFADELDRCDAALRPFTEWSVAAVLRGDAGAPSLDRVDVVQPALFAVMVSLAAVWRARASDRTPSSGTARARSPRPASRARSASTTRPPSSPCAARP
ncbi:acyltransferase domain-containing protein [Streptomyces diastatochromogenes]|nr:acyltransferase domain-containing protein [Streptomyces diastatochromogenes]